MTRTELIIQLLKILIGLAFGAYFVWWSLEVLDRLTPEDEVRAAVTNARLDPIQEAAIQRTLFCGFDIRKKAGRSSRCSPARFACKAVYL
jgi:hypothetical protein